METEINIMLWELYEKKKYIKCAYNYQEAIFSRPLVLFFDCT